MSAPALTCTPVFLPDPGHEDKIKHSASKDTWFYGVISKDWKGIVTSLCVNFFLFFCVFFSPTNSIQRTRE
jgi:hypothetical protein